jgi:hypothetical protein
VSPYLIDGFDQHRVAALMGVNPGRVNEVVVAVRNALEDKRWEITKKQSEHYDLRAKRTVEGG